MENANATALAEKMSKFSTRTLGYCRRGESAGQTPVTASLASGLADEKVSFCGVKGFLIDEIREFTQSGSPPKEIACAMVAVLEITDSPVHIHSETTETYTVLSGKGQMVLGEKMIDVGQGSVVAIPPGNPHGLMSTGDTPVRVLMTFSPGLAPTEHEDYRDEASCGITAKQWIGQNQKERE